MTITPYGGVERRPGFAYTAHAVGKCKLFTFQASLTLGFILEFGDNYIRFFINDSPVQDGGSDYILATPYSENDLSQLQLAQVNNVAYITHPSHAPQKLVRYTNSYWSLNEIDFSYPAMLSVNNITTQKLTTSATGEVGDSITLTSNFNLFTSLDVGAYYELSHDRDPNNYSVKLAATSDNAGLYSPVIIVQGSVSFRTQGVWKGRFDVQKDSGDGFVTIASYSSELDSNYSASFEESDRVLMRLKWNHVNNGSSKPAAYLETNDSVIKGVVRVTTVNSQTSAIVEVIKAVEQGSTSNWKEGAWSNKQGYPRAVAAHDQRIIYGGTKLSPQTIWGSAVDDYENFESGIEDSDSWSHSLISGQANDIQWIISQKALLIGTTGDEWVLSSGKEEATITPTNVRARRHSSNGSEMVKPILIDDSAIFAQRGGRVIREMAYSFDSDGYKTVELSLLAQHITGTGVKDMALQTQPDLILWCVTNDGRLLGLTYDKGQNVTAWHRHTTGNPATDTFESLAVQQVEGKDDILWVSVRRFINGVFVRYIERLKPEGFFLDPQWELLYTDTYGVDPWTLDPASTWDIYKSYSVGDIKTYTTSLIYCLVAHTNTISDTTPDVAPDDVGITTEKWVEVNDWFATLGASAIVGEWYQYDGSIYRVIQNHTTATSKTPGISNDWDLYFEFKTTYSSPVEWTQSFVYTLGEFIISGGARYQCISTHTSAATYEPGVGATWATKWVIDTYYDIDDIATVDGLPYKCIVAHDPSAASKPTTGYNWTSYWVLSQNEYNEDEYTSNNGSDYICIATHTPSTLTEPGIGIDWETYWELITEENNVLFYVDSGVTIPNPGIITEVTGLDHLEGETVQIVADNAVLKERVVSGGAIQLDQPGDPTGEITNISVGLRYDSILEPLALELGMQNGTSTSREKRIHELVIYFQESYGCKVAAKTIGPFDKLSFYDPNNPNSPVLFSGPKLHRLESNHDLEASFVLKQDMPMPMQVLAIIPKFNVYGDT